MAMATPDTPRVPCPYCILDDVGKAFSTGAFGGAAFYFLKGVYNSPKGERFTGASQVVRMNVPRVAGSFAVWCGLFSAFDCTMVNLRQRDDPWNSIVAGAATGGVMQMRRGLGTALRSAAFGVLLLASVEGAGIFLSKVMAEYSRIEEPVPNTSDLTGYPTGQRPGNVQVNVDGPQAPSPSSSSSWFEGIFGNRITKESGTNVSNKTHVLQRFVSPSPPSFEYK